MITFSELNLSAPIQRALQDEKYTTPTPIQAKTIPEALLGRDVLGCAQTGTGKTAAFALPILNQLADQNRRPAANRPQALVLAPTRELAIQIGENCSAYGRHLKVRQAVIFGGVGQASQVQALNQGVHLVIATPGRLLDLKQQGYLKLDQLEIFVLDEADRMLDMGFLPDLKKIIAALPARRQSLFFSATLPPEIVQLSGKLLTNPIQVNVSPPSSTVELIDQKVMFVERHQKRDVLLKILSSEAVGQTLVFTQTKRAANQLAQQLTRYGVNAAAIHGNKSQNARQRALEEFRREKIRVLVATDLAARGIDVEGITHVINFELPREPESYVHRIGRTGRAGETGIALSLCESRERSDLQAIERLIRRRIPVASSAEFLSGPKLKPAAEGTASLAADTFGDGVFSEGPASRGTSRRRRSPASAAKSASEGSSAVPRTRRTDAEPAAPAAAESRRAYGRRPNRRATEEYKAAGSGKAQKQNSSAAGGRREQNDAAQRTSSGSGQAAAPDSSDSGVRRRSRRPRRRLADASRSS